MRRALRRLFVPPGRNPSILREDHHVIHLWSDSYPFTDLVVMVARNVGHHRFSACEA